MFNEDGEVFLSDFGIVKLAEGSEAYTQTGATLGTPQYMSPEQIDNIDVDGRSDLYALGVILFEMLAGQKPYDHESQSRVLIMHLSNPVPNILEIKSDLPAGIADVIRKAMAKNPVNRYQSGAEMIGAIKEALSPSRTMSSPNPKTELANKEATDQSLNFKPKLETPPDKTNSISSISTERGPLVSASQPAWDANQPSGDTKTRESNDSKSTLVKTFFWLFVAIIVFYLFVQIIIFLQVLYP